jgi:nitroreductase
MKEMSNMELKDVLFKRRSVRKFTEQEVPNEFVEELLHAAMSGPSACNRCPWEFFVVTNKELLINLKDSSRFTKINAPLAIVVCGNLEYALPKDMSSYWIQDCSAATENILLRVTDLGLGAVWCGIYPQVKPEEKVRELLNLDSNLIPLNIIFIGYPLEEPLSRDQFDLNKIHYIK